MNKKIQIKIVYNIEVIFLIPTIETQKIYSYYNIFKSYVHND